MYVRLCIQMLAIHVCGDQNKVSDSFLFSPSAYSFEIVSHQTWSSIFFTKLEASAVNLSCLQPSSEQGCRCILDVTSEYLSSPHWRHFYIM